MRKEIILSALAGTIVGAMFAAKIEGNILKETERTSAKHLAMFHLMNQWVKVKQEGKNLSLYFEENGYKKVAVYGMSYAGKSLINELKDSHTTVAYGIDKRADAVYADIDVVSMEDELQKVDAVVVTVITLFDAIKRELSEKIDCPIISLEDILYEV